MTHFQRGGKLRRSWLSKLMKLFRFSSFAIAIISLLTKPLMAQRPLGTDVSGHQPANIDWTTVKNAGVVFGWTKATEGTGYVNPNFPAQVTGATGVGMYMGAYHYARPGLNSNITGSASADSEAAYFWSTAGPYIKNSGGYLMPM